MITISSWYGMTDISHHEAISTWYQYRHPWKTFTSRYCKMRTYGGPTGVLSPPLLHSVFGFGDWGLGVGGCCLLSSPCLVSPHRSLLSPLILPTAALNPPPQSHLDRPPTPHNHSRLSHSDSVTGTMPCLSRILILCLRLRGAGE